LVRASAFHRLTHDRFSLSEPMQEVWRTVVDWEGRPELGPPRI